MFLRGSPHPRTKVCLPVLSPATGCCRVAGVIPQAWIPKGALIFQRSSFQTPALTKSHLLEQRVKALEARNQMFSKVGFYKCSALTDRKGASRPDGQMVWKLLRPALSSFLSFLAVLFKDKPGQEMGIIGQQLKVGAMQMPVWSACGDEWAPSTCGKAKWGS